MPATTSAVNACDAVIRLQNPGGQADISGSSNEVNLDLLNALGLVYVFGSKFPIRRECKKDASVSMKIIYTQEDQEALTILHDWYFNTGGSKVFQVDVPDSAVGSDRYEFELYLEKASIPLKTDDAAPILVSMDMKPTGTFSRSVIGS